MQHPAPATTSTAADVITRSVELRPVPPYDFAPALAYLATSPSGVLERIETETTTYRRALRLAGTDVLLTVRPTGTVESPVLRLEVRGAGVPDAVMAAAEERVRRIFTLDADPAPFARLVADDAPLAGVMARWHGLRPILVATPYETLIWAILGQQITIRFAATLKARLAALAGRTLTVGGVTYPLMARPEDVAALDPDVLRANAFSRQKAAYVIAVSRAVASGALDFAALAALPSAEAVAELTCYNGIGRWTAEYLLMRGLGAPDSIPAGDLGLRQVMGRAYGLGRHATEAEVRSFAERWAPYRGWAAFTWWYALQQRML